MSRLSASLLGALDLRLADQPITTFEYDKVRALLCYLMVESDRPHRRESLAGLLWPEYAERAARQSLSQALLVLRRAIDDRDSDPAFLHITTQTLQFNTDSDYTLDVSEFTALIDAVQQHAHSDLIACDTCLLDLVEAAALYQGDFMTGFSLPDCPEFEIWLTLIRERSQQRAMAAFYHLSKVRFLSGDYEGSFRYAQSQVTLDNLREPAYRQAMAALAMSGQRSAALVQYETCERVLREELGILPEPATSVLYQEISSGAYNSEQQMGKPLDKAQPAIPNNLPYEVSPFIGRAALLAQIHRNLLDADSRWLTLLGPGGAGKTRLAQESARPFVKGQHNLFSDGIYFVPLTSIETVQGMVPAIAQAINHTFSGQLDPQEELFNVLHSKSMLLILDNFEHLTAGAGLLVDLLRIAPDLKVLITTRVKPDISVEQVISVPGMVYPDKADGAVTVEAFGALQLFQQFARRVMPDFSVDERNQKDVVRICQLAYGMPLGLLLASAWMNMLNPSEIVAEIERNLDFLSTDWLEIPARQSSMRAVFEHTWKLLTAKEQRMLASLAVFKDGWTRDSALEVVQVTLRDLLALINKCLVQRTSQGRYGMHELLRQFAQEKLSENPNLAQQAHEAHAQYFGNKLSTWWHDIRGPNFMNTVSIVNADLANVHSAIDWLVTHRRLDCLENGLDCLGHYYAVTKLVQDGASYFLKLAGNLGDPNDDVTRLVSAKIFNQYTVMLNAMSQIKIAQERSEETLKLFNLTYESALKLQYTDLPPTPLTRRILLQSLFIAAANHIVNDYTRVRHLFAMCYRYYTESGNTWLRAIVLHNLAITYTYTYQRILTGKILDEAIDIYQDLQETRNLIRALTYSGFNAVCYGDAEKSDAEYARAAQVAKVFGVTLDFEYRVSRTLAKNQQGRYEESLHDFIQIKQDCLEWASPNYILTIDRHIGRVYCQLGRYLESIKMAKQNYEYAVKEKTDILIMYSLGALSTAYLGAGQVQQAFDYEHKWDKLRKELGVFAYATFHPLFLYAAGRYSEVLEPVVERLQYVMQSHQIYQLYELLPMVSLALLTAGKIERAVEVYTLACAEPYIGNNVWVEDVSGKYVKQAAANLPGDVVAAAEARGRELDFWETAEALIKELEALEQDGK